MSLPPRLKKVFVKDSHAEREKPAEQRVAELRNEGKSDRQIAVIMRMADHYNPREVVRALSINIPTLTKYVREGEQVMQVFKSSPEDDQSSMSESGDTGPSPQISTATLDERSKALIQILDTTTGIGAPMIQKLVRRYQARAESYDNNPGLLYMMLINAGVPWYRAQNVVTEWLFEVNPDHVLFGPYGGRQQGPSGEAPVWMFDPWGSGKGRRRRNGDGGQEEGPDEEEEEERKFERKLDKQFNRAMMVAVMNSMGGKQQGGFAGFPGGGFMPFMGATFEPMVDKEGKIVHDEYGGMVMRVSYSPMAMPEGKKDGESNDKIVTILADALKSEKDAKAQLTETFATKLADLSENQVKMLTDRINALESSDPLEYVTGVFSKLKELGLGEKPENTDVAKMNVDLKRWMHEQDSSLRKWIFEQKQTFEDKKYAREQMRQFMSVGKEAIDKMGAPVAEAFKEGYVKGSRGNGSRQPSRQEKPIGEYTDEDLLKLQEEASKAERVVEDSKKKIVAEINRRGLNV